VPKQFNLQQGSSEWMTFRRDHIGSSDTPVILGVSPYSTKIDLYNDKVHGKSKIQSFSMKRGHDLEPIARALFEDEIGDMMLPGVFESSDRSFMAASLDGISVDHKTLVEIKCPSRVDHEKAVNGIVPEKYVPQLQKQLLVMGLDHMYYYSFDGKNGASLRVYRNDAMIKRIIEEEEIFWQCIKGKKPPSCHSREGWIDIARDLAETRKLLEPLEEKEKILRAKLEEVSNGENLIHENLKFTSFVMKGSVDYASIPELQGVDLDAYRKPAQKRYRFSF
jgi:hypothetical protein